LESALGGVVTGCAIFETLASLLAYIHFPRTPLSWVTGIW